jgi:hypothetical protein
MPPRDDDEREKPSWREIDRMRDHSRHTDGERRSYQERTLRSDWAKKQHLREAEKFFQGKKGTEKYKKAEAALHEKYGTSEFPQAAEEFMGEFGLPDSWGTLLLLLDSQNPKWIKQAVAVMKELYPKRSLIEQRAFKGKIKGMAGSAREREVRVACAELLESL